MSGAGILGAIKLSAGIFPPVSLVIGHPPVALLRPVATAPDRIDLADVSRLSDWRNTHRRSFLTEFEATPARTTRWLVTRVRTNNGKVLFMVDDITGRTVGYMGLDCIDWITRYGEADAIVRGEDTPKGFMRTALLGLLSWARDALGLTELGVRVLSDNPAVRFYEGLGFATVRTVPLRMDPAQDGCSWVEDPSQSSSTRQLLHMRLQQGGIPGGQPGYQSSE